MKNHLMRVSLAKKLAEFLGTKHHLNNFKIKNLNEKYFNFLQDLDEPFIDASYLPTSLLCEETKKKR